MSERVTECRDGQASVDASGSLGRQNVLPGGRRSWRATAFTGVQCELANLGTTHPIHPSYSKIQLLSGTCSLVLVGTTNRSIPLALALALALVLSIPRLLRLVNIRGGLFLTSGTIMRCGRKSTRALLVVGLALGVDDGELAVSLVGLLTPDAARGGHGLHTAK